jgi:hypothetical protein
MLEKNANRKFNWFDMDMVKDIVNTEGGEWWKYLKFIQNGWAILK